MRSLWTARNIDFYGNEQVDEEKKELTKEEIQNNLSKAKEIIGKVEENLKPKPDSPSAEKQAPKES